MGLNTDPVENILAAAYAPRQDLLKSLDKT